MQHFRYYIGVGFMFFLVQLISAQEPKNAQVDSIFQKTLINGISLGIPGISVAIGKGDSIYWSGTAGFSNLEQQIPIKTDTKFGIGSITKTFVAIVALQLAEEGQLNLGKVPSDYLDPSDFQGIANFDKAPIKTLLSHQSGIPSFEFDPRWIQDGRGVSLKPDHIWSKKEPLDYIKNAPALFAPGEDYDYSNTNYTLLGLIIEHITNPLHQEIRQRILEPLRLRDTYLQSFETIPGGYADNYLPNLRLFESCWWLEYTISQDQPLSCGHFCFESVHGMG